MAALRKVAPQPGFELDEAAAVPEVGPTDVLVRVRYAGICGTDRHIHDWDPWSAARVPLGIVVGHELYGTVVETGSAVTGMRPGLRVSAEGHIGCGGCQPCRTGQGHICERVDILGVDRDGCFAEFVSLPAANVWPVHPEIPDAWAALMDPLGNAMHTVMAAGVSGRSVLVTGAGVIGLLAISIARAAGAASVIVTDLDPGRLDLARHLGADVTLTAADPSWPEQARRFTAGQGPERWLEMSGSPAALRGGFAALRNGGTAALLGLPEQDVALDLPNDIIFKGATVLGVNGRRIYQTWYQVEAFLLSGRVPVDSVLSHVVPMADHHKAFELLGSGDGLKVVLELGT